MRAVFGLLLFAACASPGNNGTDGGGGNHDGGLQDTTPQVDAGPIMPSSAVTIIVEPNGNRGSEVVNAVKAAQHTVYMTMYQLDNTTLISALVARKAAGLDVKVILDSATTGSNNKSWNTPAFNQLQSAGVGVVWSNSTKFTYTHEKTIMIDGTSAWIMTMNENTSPPSSNRDYLALDTEPADVAEAIAIFNADFANQAITPSGSLVVADDNARPLLVQLIGSATKTLDIEVEEFSDTNTHGITNAVVQAAQRGVTVHVVIATDTLTANAMQSDSEVTHAGGKVMMSGPTSSNGSSTHPYIHAKAVLVDCVNGTCARGFVGSENFSGGSVGYNRELGVIFDNATELAKVKTAIDADFAIGVAQ
jgi:phosphatidylserine/phosphatidylglycerophosphate/cardiolipin synthase-like enzyme